LMVKRGGPPQSGRWSIPGGSIEEGERAEAAAAREVLEETGVTVRPTKVVLVHDLIERDPRGRVRFHYAIVDVLCQHVRGEPLSASDAADARWIPVRELREYDVSEGALKGIAAGLRDIRPHRVQGSHPR
ncbi:MAG: NUDIX domain-containing protein, partial [Methanobacteriota archaeon]